MSTHMYGFIEELKNNKWKWSEDLDFSANYDFFGWLCGIRNYSKFIPFISKRPFPNDMDTALRGYITDKSGESFYRIGSELYHVTSEELRHLDLKGIIYNYRPESGGYDSLEEPRPETLENILPKEFIDLIDLAKKGDKFRYYFGFD